MITLGEFTELLLSDFLEARRYADACAASISEEYHVNPLLQGMPIPRYTISEAELDVPVHVMGISQPEITKEDIRHLLDKIRHRLPTLLYRNIKNNYYTKEEARVYRENGTIEPDTVGASVKFNESTDSQAAQIIRLSSRPQLRACYKSSTASICMLMNQYMETYISENNVSEMNLLDFTDAFIATLRNVTKQEFSLYPDIETPFTDKEALKKMCQDIGNSMFFEFKEIFGQTKGILISPETTKMEQQYKPEQLMHMKIKIREQDVDFIVNQNEKTGETHRFMSLS